MKCPDCDAELNPTGLTQMDEGEEFNLAECPKCGDEFLV